MHFYSRLTISRKIALGFGLIFAVTTAVTLISYLALGAAGRNLALYAESADETNAAASLEASMLTLKMQVNEFLATGSDTSVESYSKAKAALDAGFETAEMRMVDSSRAAQVAAAKRLLADYDGAFRHGRHLQSAVERKERAAADRAYLVAHGLLNVLAA